MSLHIYEQCAHHDPIYIVGSPESLSRLAKALGIAARAGAAVLAESTGDGEAYDVRIVAAAEDNSDQWAVPYTTDYATEIRESAMRPWQIWRQTQSGKE